MRFVCEWCFEKIEIVHRDSPYGEALAHLSACQRRSPEMTLTQVAGLAAHIAAIVADRDEFACPACGSAIRFTIGSWSSIQHQVQEHIDACERRRTAVAGAATKQQTHGIAEDITVLPPRGDRT